MNNTFSLEQLSKTGSFDFNLIFRQYKPDLLAGFMEIKSLNPKLGQDQISKELGCLTSTLQRYRNDINMLSSFKNPQSSQKRRRRIQIHTSMMTHIASLTSKDLK